MNCVEEPSRSSLLTAHWTMPLSKLGERRYYLGTFFKVMNDASYLLNSFDTRRTSRLRSFSNMTMISFSFLIVTLRKILLMISSLFTTIPFHYDFHFYFFSPVVSLPSHRPSLRTYRQIGTSRPNFVIITACNWPASKAKSKMTSSRNTLKNSVYSLFHAKTPYINLNSNLFKMKVSEMNISGRLEPIKEKRAAFSGCRLGGR